MPTNRANLAELTNLELQDTLGVAQLEQYLWTAADILRESIDSSDYKTYIFGLLF